MYVNNTILGETIQFKKFEESFETLKKQLNAMPHRANKIISLR